jgi:hypothetical protein
MVVSWTLQTFGSIKITDSVWHFIAWPWSLSATPLHDRVEGLEIRAIVSISEKSCKIDHLPGNNCCNERYSYQFSNTLEAGRDCLKSHWSQCSAIIVARLYYPRGCTSSSICAGCSRAATRKS